MNMKTIKSILLFALAQLLPIAPLVTLCLTSSGVVHAQGALKYGDHSARKAELDAAARVAGFTAADYPYYSSANGCGPDGWKNKAVPDCIAGVSFAAACDQHDRDYMEVGFDRKAADDRMLEAMLRAHANWLKEKVKTTVVRTGIREVPKVVTRFVDVPKNVKVLLPGILGLLPKLVWKTVIERQEIKETILELIPYEVTEVVDVARESLLTAAQVAAQQAAINLYYMALRNIGEGFYAESQAKQASYEAWVAEYLRSH
jgi:hypothetical protein